MRPSGVEVARIGRPREQFRLESFQGAVVSLDGLGSIALVAAREVLGRSLMDLRGLLADTSADSSGSLLSARVMWHRLLQWAKSLDAETFQCGVSHVRLLASA